MSSGGRRILFQLSGSIACFKACQVISSLRQSGHEVRVARNGIHLGAVAAEYRAKPSRRLSHGAGDRLSRIAVRPFRRAVDDPQRRNAGRAVASAHVTRCGAVLFLAGVTLFVTQIVRVAAGRVA